MTNLSLKATQGSPEDQAISSISNSLDTIRAAYLAKYGADADSETQIARNLAPEYSRSMADDVATLNRLPADPSPRLANIREILDDVKVKAQAVTQASSLTAGVFPSMVQLNITVVLSAGSRVASSAEVSVRANPHHFGTNPPATYILTNGIGTQSSRIPPGRFWVWVEVNHKMIRSQEWDFGLAGSTSANVQFSL